MRMIGHKYHSTFTAVNLTNAVAGNYIVGLLKYSRMNKKRVRFNMYFSIGLTTVQAVLCLYVLTEPEKIQDKEQSLAVISMESLGTFCTVYLLVNSHRITRLIEETVDLLLAFADRSREGSHSHFEKYLRPADLYGAISCAVMVALPVVDSLMKFIDSRRASTGFVKNLNYHLPFEPKTSPAFEMVLTSESICMLYSCAKPAGINHLFLTLFTLLSAFYSRLGYEIRKDLFLDRPSSQTRVPLDAKEIFKKWIQIHQQIISIGNEVISLYSPVLLVFQINLFASMVMVVFSATQNAVNHSTAELIIFLSYSSVTLLNFFAVCLAANKLAEESERIKWAAYDTKWYRYNECGNKVSCSYMKIMMTRANVPQVVTCFSSTAFKLSNATFITVVKSIASFYIALGQMKGKI